MYTSDDFSIDRDGRLGRLAKHIERHLKEREFYLVFEDEVERCWPSNIENRERERQIQDFAKSRGWKAFIFNTESGGTRAMFLHQ